MMQSLPIAYYDWPVLLILTYFGIILIKGWFVLSVICTIYPSPSVLTQSTVSECNIHILLLWRLNPNRQKSINKFDEILFCGFLIFHPIMLSVILMIHIINTLVKEINLQFKYSAHKNCFIWSYIVVFYIFTQHLPQFSTLQKKLFSWRWY